MATLHLMETRPALLTIAMKIYCDGIDPRKLLDDLKNHVIGKLNGKVLYDYGSMVLEFPYQLVSVASKAYISAIARNYGSRDGFISLILSILDLMYPFIRIEDISEYTEKIIEYFENLLEEICEEGKIYVNIVDTRFYDYPFRLQDIERIRF